MMYIKGFDKDLCCRGMQFEVGEIYETGYPKEELECCSETVIHFCDSLQDVHRFYDVRENHRYCEVEPLGDVVKEYNKYGTNKIKIVREIIGEELSELKGLKRGNTGIFNTGNRNTGLFNSCNCSTGVFNTKERTITIFNKDSGMTWNEFYNSKYFDAINSSGFNLTEWIWYTEEEMKDSPIRQCIRGYLKQYTFEEACQNWWNNMPNKDKELIKGMPNFDADIFEEITGIEVQE